ncbi:gp43 [Burkholderia pseudomallei]|nr:gp43 [Burkholderia pseudomallei]
MTTTENSRDDALAVLQELSKWAAGFSTWQDEPKGPYLSNIIADARRIVSASTSSQPAAAPIDDPTIPAELHHDTAKLVRRFARALANKLLAAQRKYGYSDNWMRDGWADECRAELMRHIQKGDPRDVAAYCAFLWHHNESTATTPSPVDERAAFENSRADALTDDEIDAIYERVHAEWEARNKCAPNLWVAFARAILAASPVEQPAPSLIDEDAEVPPIMYNGDTKRDPALRELLARQATRHVLTNSRGDSKQPAAAPADDACKRCGSTTAQACNDAGCFYLESGDGEPSAAPADERAVSFEAWCDRFPEISAVERLRDAWQEARAALPEARIDWIANTHCPGGTAYPVNVKNAIREALREARISDNETEAQVAQQLSAEIRELKVKLGSYEREREDQIRYLAAQSEEIAGLKQQLAHADARVGLTATVIQKCIDSCAAEYLEDVTGHPEDAAYCQGITDCIDALNRLKTADWSAILAAHSGQSEPETATVARIEQLRKALFESRDAMRVMSNWVKKSDPAGHSWAVRMVDRANAALNGEPETRAEVMPLKVERHSDMSVLVVFNSCRQASVFEREIAVRIQGVES